VLRSDLHPFGEPDARSRPREPANGARFGQEIGPGMFTTGLISAVLGTRLPGSPEAVYLVPEPALPAAPSPSATW
jgi:hypothetical protein